MKELIHNLVNKADLTEAQATKVAEVVRDYLGEKLPDPLRGPVLGALTGALGQFDGRLEVERTAKQDRTAPNETETPGFTLVNAAIDWHPLAELVPANQEPLLPPMVTLQIAGGRKEKIRAGDVLGALTGEAGFAKEQVGKININDFSTYVAVDRAIAQEAVRRLSSGRVKGKSVKVRLLDAV